MGQKVSCHFLEVHKPENDQTSFILMFAAGDLQSQ